MDRMHYRLGFFLFIFLFFNPGCKNDQAVENENFNTENTVYVRLPAGPRTLNPLLSTDLYSRLVFEELFQYLLKYDPQTLELQPVLVKGLPEADPIVGGPYDGGVGYTFEIREEAMWDNGSPITPKDVAFTLKALFHPKVNATAVRGYFEYVRDLQVDPENPQRFTVLTEKYILNEPAITNIPIYPEYAYDPEGLLNQHPLSQWADPEEAAALVEENEALMQFAERFNSPVYSREKENIVGSGPYRLLEWETDQQVTLERKKDWWGDALAENNQALRAFPDKIVFRIIPDQTAAMTAIKDQLVDVANQIDAKDFTDLKADEMVNANYNFYNPVTFQLYYIGINNKNPKLEDKRVRRALAHVIDVDGIIRDLYYGLAERVNSPFHPQKSYYHDELPMIDYSIEKASGLLKEAGWEDTDNNGIVDKEIGGEQVEMKLTYLTSTASSFGKKLALLLQENAKRAGIEIEIVQKEFQSLIGDLRQRNYELNGGAWAQEPIPDDPKQAWHTDSDRPDGFNRVSFGNAQSDALIDEIRVTLDDEKRDSLYRVFQEIVYEQQPVIFLFAPQERIVIHKRFETEITSLRPGYVLDDFKIFTEDH